MLARDAPNSVDRHVSYRAGPSYRNRHARYLAEVYCTRRDADGSARARATAPSLEGRLVRLQSEIFIPADETWLLFYSAPSAEAVVAVLQRAGIRANRVVETT